MKEIQLLLIEDNEADAGLLLRELTKSGYTPQLKRIETPDALTLCLQSRTWDIIISDYNLPQFNGMEALAQVKETGLDVPFIIVSGLIGEETATGVMRLGADDYLMKDNLSRLAPAVERALREAENRRQRRLAEQQNREAKAQLEALFNSSNQATYLLAEDYTIRRLNQLGRASGLVYFGREPKVGQSMLDYIPEACHATFRENFARCLAGESIYYEQAITYPAQGKRWFQVKYYPVFDANGAPIGVAYNTFDISSRKQAEVSLLEMKLQLETIITSARDAIVITDEARRIILTNAAARTMFGYAEEALLHQPIQHLIPASGVLAPIGLPDNPGAEEPAWPTSGTLRLLGVKADGTPFPVEASISPTEAMGKQYSTVILRDISLRLQAEQQEKQLNQELNRQNQQLQQFGYITSHTLRGPVATILGLLNLLDKDNLGSPANAGIVGYLADTATRLDGIIHDLVKVLDYQKNYQATYETVVLVDVLADVQARLAPAIEAANARIEADLDGAAQIWSVRDYIQSIFHNLLSNAIKYRSPKREPLVRMAARTENGWVVFTFADNSLGIDLQQHGHRLFGMYSRFHFHTEGKGLGLYLVKTQVEALNGKIDIQSTEGEGTVFTVRLPATS
jgi:PAS domain S-box-containing protein